MMSRIFLLCIALIYTDLGIKFFFALQLIFPIFELKKQFSLKNIVRKCVASRSGQLKDPSNEFTSQRSWGLGTTLTKMHH